MIRSVLELRCSNRLTRVPATLLVFGGLSLGALSAGCAGAEATGSGGSGSTGSSTTAKGTTAAATTAAAATAASGSTSTGSGSGFACLGAPLPTTAPATITITGNSTTAGLSGQMLLPTVTIDLFEGTATVPTKSTTSDLNGAYSVLISTSGVPVDGYIHGTKATYKDSYLYPPRPLATDTGNATLLLVTPGTFGLLESLGGVTQNAGDGWIGVVVSDCNDMPVAGATVTTAPAGTVRYNAAGGVPSNTATATDADGVAYVFNVAAGDVTVQAQAGGNTLREHVINARADVVTTTVIQP